MEEIVELVRNSKNINYTYEENETLVLKIPNVKLNLDGNQNDGLHNQPENISKTSNLINNRQYQKESLKRKVDDIKNDGKEPAIFGNKVVKKDSGEYKDERKKNTEASAKSKDNREKELEKHISGQKTCLIRCKDCNKQCMDKRGLHIHVSRMHSDSKN